MQKIAPLVLAFEFLCVVIAIIAAIDRNPLAAGALGLVGLTLLVIHAGKLIGRLDRFRRGEIVLDKEARPDGQKSEVSAPISDIRPPTSALCPLPHRRHSPSTMTAR